MYMWDAVNLGKLEKEVFGGISPLVKAEVLDKLAQMEYEVYMEQKRLAELYDLLQITERIAGPGNFPPPDPIEIVRARIYVRNYENRGFCGSR